MRTGRKDPRCSQGAGSEPASPGKQLIETFSSVIDFLTKTLEKLIDGMTAKDPQTKTPAPVESSPSAAEPDRSFGADKLEFQSYVGELLGRSKGERVNEKELFFASAAYLIGQRHGEEASAAFQDSFRAASPELDQQKAVENALKQLADEGRITRAEAEQINGEAFRSAQLDNRRKRLSEDRAASTGFKRAANRAFEQLVLITEMGMERLRKALP